jgi:hypothetical protein
MEAVYSSKAGSKAALSALITITKRMKAEAAALTAAAAAASTRGRAAALAAAEAAVPGPLGKAMAAALAEEPGTFYRNLVQTALDMATIAHCNFSRGVAWLGEGLVECGEARVHRWRIEHKERKVLWTREMLPQSDQVYSGSRFTVNR